MNFEELWQYQQGALFLKKDSIYDMRKDLAEYFYKAGQEQLQNRFDKAIEALKYYAGADQWGHISKDDATYSVMDSDDLGIGEFQFNEIVDDERVAGLKARRVLREVGEE